MSFGATSAWVRLCPAGIGMALSCLATGMAFAQGGQKIEFSSPQSGVVVSNLNQFGNKQPGQKQLEEDLSRPFESLNPDSSLGAVVDGPSRPPTPRQAPSKREKELDDLRRNWVFANPDDITKGPTPEQIFGLKEYDKNGEEKKPMSTIDKFLERKRSGTDEQSDASFGKKENDVYDPLQPVDPLEPFDGGINKPGQMLKGLFGSNPDARTATRPTTFNGLSTSDLMKAVGLQDTRTKDEKARMDERMDEFRQLLGTRSALPSTGSSLDPLTPQTNPNRLPTPAKSLDPFNSQMKQDALNPFQTGINPGNPNVFQPAGLQDFSPRGFGSPDQLSPLPPPTPVPKVQPPQPTFSLPKRKF